MRLLVTSATYRQSSRLTPALRERDPENRLLAPWRALSSAGGVCARSGARRRAGSWSPRSAARPCGRIIRRGSTSRWSRRACASGYVQGKGDELHRRSLYTYWKRSVPHPAMLAFDAPFREACTLRRPRTNTPLQALNLMNDPTYVEAARLLAQRMMREGGADHRSAAHARVPARPRPPAAPAGAGRAHPRLRALAARIPSRCRSARRTSCKSAKPAHDAKLDSAELAALTTVASTLLCMDQTITKE